MERADEALVVTPSPACRAVNATVNTGGDIVADAHPAWPSAAAHTPPDLCGDCESSHAMQASAPHSADGSVPSPACVGSQAAACSCAGAAAAGAGLVPQRTHVAALGGSGFLHGEEPRDAPLQGSARPLRPYRPSASTKSQTEASVPTGGLVGVCPGDLRLGTLQIHATGPVAEGREPPAPARVGPSSPAVAAPQSDGSRTDGDPSSTDDSQAADPTVLSFSFAAPRIPHQAQPSAPDGLLRHAIARSGHEDGEEASRHDESPACPPGSCAAADAALDPHDVSSEIQQVLEGLHRLNFGRPARTMHSQARAAESVERPPPSASHVRLGSSFDGAVGCDAPERAHRAPECDAVVSPPEELLDSESSEECPSWLGEASRGGSETTDSEQQSPFHTAGAHSQLAALSARIVREAPRETSSPDSDSPVLAVPVFDRGAGCREPPLSRPGLHRHAPTRSASLSWKVARTPPRPPAAAATSSADCVRRGSFTFVQLAPGAAADGAADVDDEPEMPFVGLQAAATSPRARARHSVTASAAASGSYNELTIHEGDELAEAGARQRGTDPMQAPAPLGARAHDRSLESLRSDPEDGGAGDSSGALIDQLQPTAGSGALAPCARYDVSQLLSAAESAPCNELDDHHTHQSEFQLRGIREQVASALRDAGAPSLQHSAGGCSSSPPSTASLTSQSWTELLSSAQSSDAPPAALGGWLLRQDVHGRGAQCDASAVSKALRTLESLDGASASLENSANIEQLQGTIDQIASPGSAAAPSQLAASKTHVSNEIAEPAGGAAVDGSVIRESGLSRRLPPVATCVVASRRSTGDVPPDASSSELWPLSPTREVQAGVAQWLHSGHLDSVGSVRSQSDELLSPLSRGKLPGGPPFIARLHANNINRLNMHRGSASSTRSISRTISQSSLSRELNRTRATAVVNANFIEGLRTRLPAKRDGIAAPVSLGQRFRKTAPQAQHG